MTDDPLSDPDFARLVTQKLMRGADHPWEVEQPPTFDPIDARKRFMRVARDVNAIVGMDCLLELWPAVNHATFHGEIVLPTEAMAEPASAVIRASNFADLITILDDDRPVKPDVLSRLRRRFERNGYRYLPAAELQGRYDGHHRGTGEFGRWADRYFGYRT